jgi:hypothetical protein
MFVLVFADDRQVFATSEEVANLMREEGFTLDRVREQTLIYPKTNEDVVVVVNRGADWRAALRQHGVPV